ncbi:MAG TPA: hypothetical protein VII75_17005 [Thermoanaerobaculia bacterium]
MLGNRAVRPERVTERGEVGAIIGAGLPDYHLRIILPHLAGA